VADNLDIVLEMLRQMEATLNGLQQLRDYVGQGVGRQMLEEIIEELAKHLTEIERTFEQ
jgi:GNAT superfamily N-acetyltransferase